jgi:hypothetical protein
VKPVIKQPTAKRSKADEAPPARGKRESCHVELGAGAAPPRKAPKRRVLLSSSEEEEEEEEEKEAEAEAEEKDDDDEEVASDEDDDPIAQLEEQLAPLRRVIGPLLASGGGGASDEPGGSAPIGTGGAPGTAPTVPLLLPKPRSMCAALQLASHQRLGLSWLHTLHQHGYSGILADDMGLGKTLQVIALLCLLPLTAAAQLKLDVDTIMRGFQLTGYAPRDVVPVGWSLVDPAAPGAAATRMQSMRFKSASLLIPVGARIAPVIATGFRLLTVRFRKYAVSSSVAVPWQIATPAAF